MSTVSLNLDLYAHPNTKFPASINLPLNDEAVLRILRAQRLINESMMVDHSVDSISINPPHIDWGDDPILPTLFEVRFIVDHQTFRVQAYSNGDAVRSDPFLIKNIPGIEVIQGGEQRKAVALKPVYIQEIVSVAKGMDVMLSVAVANNIMRTLATTRLALSHDTISDLIYERVSSDSYRYDSGVLTLDQYKNIAMKSLGLNIDLHPVANFPTNLVPKFIQEVCKKASAQFCAENPDPDHPEFFHDALVTDWEMMSTFIDDLTLAELFISRRILAPRPDALEMPGEDTSEEQEARTDSMGLSS